MKFTHIVVTGLAIAAVALSACSKHNNASSTAPVASSPPPTAGTPAPTPPPMTSGQSLNTAAVLAQARVTSETASPYAVNNGALTLTDTSDTTQPINAN
jgi:hypothetical protein